MSNANDTYCVIKQYWNPNDGSPTKVYYMNINGTFLAKEIDGAEKFPLKYEWILDYLVQDWNNMFDYNNSIFFQKVFVRNNQEVVK